LRKEKAARLPAFGKTLDLPIMGSFIVRIIHSGENTMYELKVDGMSCGHCIKSVTGAVLEVDPAAKVNVDLAGKTVQVESSADLEAIRHAISEAGYPIVASATV
jgi:copper chaperone CopZ